MKKQALTLTSLLVVVGLLFSAFAVAPVQAAGLTPQEQSTSSALSPESLANATYKSELAASGEVTLVNGELLDEANSIFAALLPAPTATGVINGQETALVLLVENGGGSGIFINLAAMVDQDGVPVNVDTALLGDRVEVTSLTIDSDQVVVEMVAQGPDDPMCCPTQLVRQTYTIDGDQFVQISEEVIGSVPQVVIEKPIGDYTSAVIPASPYDNTQPPMLTGIPLHTVVAFEQGNPRTAMEDGTPYLAVIPAAEYAKTWSDAGDDTVANTISSLEALLQSQPVTPTTPLPLLPPPAGSNDIASNVKYLKGNGFEGVSFIGRTTFDASALLNFQLRYYFSGLTDDGQYVVTAQWPITSTAVPNTPEEVPADVQQLVNDNYEQYLADETAKLNGLADDQWSVAPSQLDAMIASTSVNRSPMLSAERLANLAYPSVLLEGQPVQLTDGKYEDTENKIVVSLMDEPRAFGKIYGEDAAAVLTVENGGGSGVFVSLAVVVDKLGEPTVMASTLLGDRVYVLNLQITEAGLIVVDMITQGPNDPFCCPTMPMTVAYALAGNKLIDVAVVSATIDTTPINQQAEATIVPATPYNNNMPPSGQGEPKHPLWTWGDNDPTTVETMWGPYVAVFNVDAYKKIWADAGDSYVADTLAELETLLAEQPANPPPPLPILPQQPATNDLAAQVKYLELPDGGAGVRWVGRLGQAVNPVTASDLHYYFQGLTGDGQRLVVAMVPLTSTVVPTTMAEIPPDVMNAMNDADSYTAYLAGVTEQLNAATAADFNPI
ncbi:MAG: LppP/LprE family lipoprotein [Anaerolineales bacterium]|nr:LppP/LprE family lipoprotein [Anaerolineales bacterium]